MNRAERNAARLLQEIGMTDERIPVEHIAKQLGVEVIHDESLDKIAGMLIRRGGRTVIAVNGNDPAQRRRFTIAHELGHLRLHPGRELFLDHSFRVNFRDENSSTATRLEEIQANAFAAELLMPSERVMRAFLDESANATDINPDELIARLAERFDVSRLAMGFRLANLGLTTLP